MTINLYDPHTRMRLLKMIPDDHAAHVRAMYDDFFTNIPEIKGVVLKGSNRPLLYDHHVVLWVLEKLLREATAVCMATAQDNKIDTAAILASVDNFLAKEFKENDHLGYSIQPAPTSDNPFAVTLSVMPTSHEHAEMLMQAGFKPVKETPCNETNYSQTTSASMS